LGTTVENTLGFHSWAEGWVDNAEGECLGCGGGGTTSVVDSGDLGSRIGLLGVVGFVAVDLDYVGSYLLASDGVLDMSANVGRGSEEFASRDGDFGVEGSVGEIGGVGAGFYGGLVAKLWIVGGGLWGEI
jgi:hypothetical protein